MVINLKYKLQVYSKLRWMFIFLGVLCVLFSFSTPVKAATTCKSAMSYPANTTTSVNMRKKAGTKYKSYGMVEKGGEVIILGYVKNSSGTWYKCKGMLSGKVKTGYILSSYVKKNMNPEGTVNDEVSSTVHVRKSAKTSSKSLAKIPRGTKLTVTGIKKKSSKYWYKVKVTAGNTTVSGYILSKYIDVKRNDETTDKPSANNNQQTPPANTTPATPEKVLYGEVNEKVTTNLNVRKEASTSSVILMGIPKGTKVTILSSSGDWYKITVTYKDKTVTGFVMKDYISLESQQTSGGTTTTPETKPGNVPANAAFDTLIKNFPESYKTSLMALHQTYPNWTFVAVNTNLDWNTVIANESVVGRNVTQSNFPKGSTTLAPFSYLSTAAGAYNWSTDCYIVKDGTNWYSVNSEVVAHYMDPRNYLNSTDIFQFEALAYDSTQSESVVQSILSNSFMKGNYSVVDSATKEKVSGSYKQAFMDAGKQAKASPYFLASRSKQEVGLNGSNSTSGTYKGYEGIYNYYNIGALDGGDAVAKGLQWARTGNSYGKPWTNPYKSIVGGAQYIAANYINKGQNTLYFQKFNVVPATATDRYLHQYMTNVQAPYAEGRTTRAAYNAMGILNDTMVFYIPVYNNMPATACKLPAVTGNPNPFLATLKVYAGTKELTGLTPTFVKPATDGTLSNNTYTIVVDATVASVKIAASTVSGYAKIEGTGTFNLGDPGTTTAFVVTGIAQNGRKQAYTVKVTRNTK